MQSVSLTKLELLGITILMKLTVWTTEVELLVLFAAIIGISCMVMYVYLTFKQLDY